MDLPAIGERDEPNDRDETEEIGLAEEDMIIEERDEEAELARGQFQLQCNRLMECIVVTSKDVNELIALYNVINNSMLPISLKLTLGLISSRIFRSMGDLDENACELSRLIELYSAPWDGRAEALRRLHAQYRRNCRLLNAAIKKLHLASASSEQYNNLRLINKWEQFFSLVMLSKDVGRRWKFKLPQLRHAAARGPDAVEAYIANEYRQSTAPIRTHSGEQNDVLDDTERGDISLVSSAKDHSESRISGSESGEDERGENEENDEEDDDDEDDDISDIDVEQFRTKPVESSSSAGTERSGGKDERSSSGKEKKSVRFDENAHEFEEASQDYDRLSPSKTCPVLESVACWTHEPDYDKRIVLRLFRPTGLRIATGGKDGHYVLRSGPNTTDIIKSSPFFSLGAAVLTSAASHLPIGDVTIDSQTLLPEDGQLELFVGDRSTAVGSINLRQLAGSDPSPILLPDEDAPLPDDYPLAVKLNIPLYSTNLGASVRVAVGLVPVSVFGIRWEIQKIKETGTVTDIVEPIREPTVVVEQHSVAISPIHWEIPDTKVDHKNEDESVTELRRKFEEQQRNMSQAMRAMDAEIRQLRQRQAECDLCSGRITGDMLTDPRIARAGHARAATTRNVGPTVGTPVPPVKYAAVDASLVRDRTNDSIVTLPAIYMPSPLGHAYNARASSYFHPIGHSGRRVTQPPSVFAMQVPGEAGVGTASTVNLYSLAVRQTETVATDQKLRLAHRQPKLFNTPD